MPLYEVVILEIPKPKNAKNGKLERIVVEPTTVVALDAEAAGFEVAMNSNDLIPDRKRMQVIVRPFS